MWPFFDAVAKRCGVLFDDYKQGNDIAKYTTTGTEDKRVEIKRPRKSDSPTKTSGATTITSGGTWK